MQNDLRAQVADLKQRLAQQKSKRMVAKNEILTMVRQLDENRNTMSKLFVDVQKVVTQTGSHVISCRETLARLRAAVARVDPDASTDESSHKSDDASILDADALPSGGVRSAAEVGVALLSEAGTLSLILDTLLHESNRLSDLVMAGRVEVPRGKLPESGGGGCAGFFGRLLGGGSSIVSASAVPGGGARRGRRAGYSKVDTSGESDF